MRKKYNFETQLTQLSLLSSVPLLLLLLYVMVHAEVSIWLISLAGLMAGILIIYTNYRIHQKLLYKFRSLSNLLDAMMQGDYSLRTRSDESYGELDKLVVSLNGLAWRLSHQRWESVESQLLVRTIIEHIDVAIVAVGDGNQVSFLNPAAKKLLRLDEAEADTTLLKQLDFVQEFSSGCHQVVELSLGHIRGRFNVHVEEFRESGIQKKLLFITDVRTLLRSEERKAWQSLVRVISHEINNSLSPITSISQTLNRMISSRGEEIACKKELLEGLTIISERAKGLSQFIESYKQLAQLPEPQKQMVSILELFKKICILFKKQSIVMAPGADVQLFIDPVQFEQVLINIFKNAMESMSQVNSDGVIKVKWHAKSPLFTLMISDQGGGFSNADNLFVPFYSTKKHGSGIGLVLCRQIIEAHDGRLSITNNVDTVGCCVTIEIPFNSSGDTTD